LGAAWDGTGANFALFSAHSERVELCIYEETGRRELQRIELPDRTDGVWHCYLPEAQPGLVYGYRVHGPYRPEEGHRFNAHKLVIDPCAKEFVGPLRWSDVLHGYTVGHRREDLSYDRRDSASCVPKCRVVDEAFTWGNDRPPAVPWHETIVYEAHVRGLTMRHPEIPPRLRGTYAALASPPMLEHFRRLGVTTLELMPVHAFIDERWLIERKLRNYWGYNTLGFFAPESRYSAGGGAAEFKTMVKRLHAAGIEVLLDVVYNHTCEGNHLGPTLSLRGIDNASYYRLSGESRRHYATSPGAATR
jgi:glycogen operon protein